MLRIVLAAMICLTALSGCVSVVPGRNAGRAPRPVQTRNAPAEKPHAESTTAEQKGLTIKEVYDITTRAGAVNGVPLSERIDVVHHCSADAKLVVSYGTPKNGVVKAYGYCAMNAHVRYYPPSRSCDDTIPFEVRASDGCVARGVIHVQVLNAEEDTAQPPAHEPVETEPNHAGEDGELTGSSQIRVSPLVCQVAIGDTSDAEHSTASAQEERFYDVVARVF